MKRKLILQTLAIAMALAGCNAGPEEKDYTRYVNPFIGTGGHGHTYPGAIVPNGMIHPSPDTRIYEWDASAGYYYPDSTLNGFSHTHLSGTGCSDYGDVLLMPTVGEQCVDGDTGNRQILPYASPFSHEKETAAPGYYSVFLDRYGVKAELTATKRAALHRYTFPESDDAGFITSIRADGPGNRTCTSGPYSRNRSPAPCSPTPCCRKTGSSLRDAAKRC